MGDKLSEQQHTDVLCTEIALLRQRNAELEHLVEQLRKKLDEGERQQRPSPTITHETTNFTATSSPGTPMPSAQDDQRFYRFFHQSKDGLVLTDQEGKVAAWNEGAETLTGLKREDVLGKPVWDVQFQIIPREDRTPDVYEMGRTMTLAFLETGQAPGLGQWIGRDIERPDGTRRSVHFLTFPIQTEQGLLLGSITRDITDLVQLDALRKEIALRKRVEQDLRQSEERYRMLIETSPDAIVMFDHEQTVLFCNQRMVEMHGYDRCEELYGIDLRTLIAPEEFERAELNLRRILENRSVKNFERMLLRKDGSRFPAEISTSVISGLEEKPVLFLSIARDITTRKQAEVALQESDLRFRTLVEAAPIAILVWQGDQLHYINKAAENLFGYPYEEARKLEVWQIVHPDSHSLIREQAEKRHAGESFDERYGIPIVTRYGDIRWLDVIATTIGTDDHAFLLVIASDMTEQKKTEDERLAALERLELANCELQRSRDLLHVTFDNIQDGLALIDHEGVVLAANRMMIELLDLPLNDIINRTWKSLDTAHKQGDTTTESCFPGLWVLESLYDGLPHHQQTHCFYAGERHTFDMQTVPVSSRTVIADSPFVELLVLHVVDVTENLKAEALLIKNEHLLANRRLTEMVAHDLSTPLQILTALFEMLPYDSELQRQARLVTAQKEIERMSLIVAKLRDVYHIPPYTEGPVDINQMIEQVQILSSGKMAKHRILCECSLSPEQPFIYGYADELIQVLFNLISNAMEFMPDGGILRLATRTDGEDTVCIDVSDTGAGISPDIQMHIFEPFFTTRAHGTGLGLSICQRIVGQHNGHICVQSKPGTGTTFSIHLPRYLRTARQR